VSIADRIRFIAFAFAAGGAIVALAGELLVRAGGFA